MSMVSLFLSRASVRPSLKSVKKIALVLTLLALAAGAQAIIIRHDRADNRYVVDEGNYPQVFSLHERFGNRVCVATLIASRWALTAAHCTDQTPLGETVVAGQEYPLHIAGHNYAAREVILHPGYRRDDPRQSVDLALIRLDRPVRDVAPVPLYNGEAEKRQVAMLLGWGFTGYGTVGRRGNDGRFRRAYNRVLDAGRWLTFRFDDPRGLSSSALPLEGIPGLGDSGGPALMETDEGLMLIGVALGEVADARRPATPQGRYGAVQLYERVTNHRAWIESNIDAPASPALSFRRGWRYSEAPQG